MTISREKCNEAYYRMLQRYADRMQQEKKEFGDLTVLEKEKYIFALVKYLTTMEPLHTRDIKKAREAFALYDSVIILLSSLTPVQFERMFPIEKTYDGERWEMKDYFSTKEVLSGLPQNEPIYQNIEMFDFMWDYCNATVRHLLVAATHSMDEIRRWMGKPSMVESFLADMESGRWRKMQKLKKQLPKWLKIVK